MVDSQQELKEKAEAWIADDPDAATREELQQLVDASDFEELTERFAARLAFGTAGIRGVIGAGPGRMNRALVRKVTAGLAQYLLQNDPQVKERGVVVGRDGRRLSREFADDTASVLAALGIPVYLFSEVVATPVCAFAVTDLKASAGIIITASHNPSEYNGYKVYASNGAQIIPPQDTGISDCIDAVESILSLPLLSAEEAWSDGLFHYVPDEVLDRYFQGTQALRRHPYSAGDLRVVYTPMHGVGWRWVEDAFERAGFPVPVVVREQAEPDAEFPTVKFPNPEEEGAMDLALRLARREKPDLILANDPDADRLAVSVPTPDGDWQALTGNEIGALLAYYLLTENMVSANPLVITTIVSSSILEQMARELGAVYAETLTGFKWIANKAIDLKKEKHLNFLFGFEEALGYTVGELVRDKDGVGTAIVFADLTAFCKSKKRTVLEYLEEIYRRFGLYQSTQKSVTLPGSEGQQQIVAIMDTLRTQTPSEFAGVPVVQMTDVQKGTEQNITEGTEKKLDLPSSNVLSYRLGDGSRVILRPSGTEPKIKFYFEVVERVKEEESLSQAGERARARLDLLEKDLLTRAGGLNEPGPSPPR